MVMPYICNAKLLKLWMANDKYNNIWVPVTRFESYARAMNMSPTAKNCKIFIFCKWVNVEIAVWNTSIAFFYFVIRFLRKYFLILVGFGFQLQERNIKYLLCVSLCLPNWTLLEFTRFAFCLSLSNSSEKIY